MAKLLEGKKSLTNSAALFTNYYSLIINFIPSADLQFFVRVGLAWLLEVFGKGLPTSMWR